MKEFNASEIENIIGYVFVDKQLLEHAFTHSSANVGKHNMGYDRLEFLGDSILDFVVADELFHRFPDAEEGILTRMRSGVVSSKPLSAVIHQLGLIDYMIFAQTETNRDFRDKVYADLFESIVGAIYCDSGIDEARSFITRMLCGNLEQSPSVAAPDSKSELLEYAGKNHWKVDYVDTASGPAHRQSFKSEVYINDMLYGVGEGDKKRDAQQSASEQALTKLREDGSI